MPVVQVFAQPVEDVQVRLAELATAVATSLGLTNDGVIVTLIPVAQTVREGHAGDHWPVVVLHGSERPEAELLAARTAAEQAVAGWPGVTEPWVTWAVRS